MFAMKFHEQVARRKLGVTEEWQPCVFERVGPDAIRLDGAIPRLLKRGPRKGKPTWQGQTLVSVIVTDAEFQAECAAYERETGLCSQCQGTKQVVCGWNREEGTKYRECRKCGATGKAA